MVRSYNRKTNRADYSAETINAAVKFVQDDGHSLRKAHEQFGVNYRTLSRYIKPRRSYMRYQAKHFQIILKKI